MPATEPYRSRSYNGIRAFIAGWGVLTQGGKSSNTLQHATVPILNNAGCTQRYRSLHHDRQFGPETICAGNLTGGVDSCQGDR